MDYINAHIIPALGNIELQKLTTLNIQELINYMLEKKGTLEFKGLSAKSVRDCIVVLKQALKQAIEWSMLERNPAEGVKIPASSREIPTRLTEKQAAEVLDSLKDTCLYPRSYLTSCRHEARRGIGAVLGNDRV